MVGPENLRYLPVVMAREPERSQSSSKWLPRKDCCERLRGRAFRVPASRHRQLWPRLQSGSFIQRDIVDVLLPFNDIKIGEIADGARSSPKGNRALRVPKLEVINQQARLK